MKINRFILGLCCLPVAGTATAQGCSDAGFCTIGNMNAHSSKTASENKQKISILFSNGIGDENVFVFTPAIQYDNKINANWAIQTKLTANIANGNLGSATGAGDLFLSSTYSLPEKDGWQISFLLGAKLPLNKGDIRTDKKPLPMQYQSSLGTADLLAGISVSNSKWLFATALQQPLSGTNRNTFLPAYWNTAAASKYSPTNSFNRKGDVLLRAGYHFIASGRAAFTIGLLGIYHLDEDTYYDGNISNSPIALKGAAGVTLNSTAVLHYKINNKISIGLTGGVPFIVRDIRPDGLTRKFVIAPEIAFKF